MTMEASPGTEPQERDRKRRRIILSCQDCRRRKLQCDRSLPACSRCVKGKKTCVYEDVAPSSVNGSNASPRQQIVSNASRHVSGQASVTVSREVWDDLLTRLSQQEKTIERAHSEYTHRLSSEPFRSNASTLLLFDHATPGLTVRQAPKENICFRGKAFETQFHGPSDPRSSLTHIPEVFVFVRDVISRSPALVRCSKELRTLREASKDLGQIDTKSGQENLMHYLPKREVADAMIQMYLDDIDTTYGILHVPSFLKDYEALWDTSNPSHPSFLVTVLLVIACVECLMKEPHRLYLAVNPMARERAAIKVQACESWLEKQSRKHTTLAYFQICCLLSIAKHMNGIKMKRQWIESGNLLRLAVAAGLHRDAGLSQKPISAFDKEMRRRIWSFIVEHDLQASLDRGMPAVSPEYADDCGLPSNLDDDDFSESSTSMPLPRPLTEFTKMSFMRLSSRSRLLRSKLTSLLNQPHPHLTYEHVLSYTQDIEQCLEALPNWPESDGVEPQVPASQEQSVALLRIQLEQFLLILHAEATRQARTDIRASFSRSTFLAASKSILGRLRELASTGRRFLLLYGQQVMRIFITIGHLASLPAKSGAIRTDNIDQLKAWLEVAYSALELFEDKIMRSGDLQWASSFAVYDLLRRQIPESELPKHTLSGCDRMNRLYKHITENQDPSFAMEVAARGERQNLTSLPPPPVTDRTTSYTQPPAAMEVMQQPPESNLGDDQFAFGGNGTELLDWNFDDWMLDNDPFWQQNMVDSALAPQTFYSRSE